MAGGGEGMTATVSRFERGREEDAMVVVGEETALCLAFLRLKRERGGG
jgi:hypothetical protein